MMEGENRASREIWSFVGLASVGVAGSLSALYAVTNSSEFRWTAPLMIVSYVIVSIAVVVVVALARRWSFPGVRDSESEPNISKGPRSHISKEHTIELQDAARSWSDEFSALVNPDWAVRVLKLENLDSDEELTRLRQHFPQVDSEYLEWRASNSALLGVPTTPWWQASGNGNKPVDSQGESRLKEHNNLARKLATTLGGISGIAGQADVTGKCDQCQQS